SSESSAGRPSIGTHHLHLASHHGSAPLATQGSPGVFRRAMEGTERVFERLVRDNQDRIFALSLALTGNRHDAEEVAQDTFLPARYREAVVLRHVQELSYAEVAEALGQPVGTVKANVHRGLKILRGENHGDGDD